MSPSTVRPLSVTTASTLAAALERRQLLAAEHLYPVRDEQRRRTNGPTSSPKVRESATPSSITIVQAVPIAVSEAATSQPM